jgi:uncharacterized ion transporter superfamily protein YfcC
MPFSPSDFEWWMWALLAAVFLLACIVCCFIADEIKNTVVAGFFWLIALVLAVGFFACAVIALKQGHVFDQLFSEANYLQEIFHALRGLASGVSVATLPRRIPRVARP